MVQAKVREGSPSGSTTAEQRDQLEAIQRRAVRIIFDNKVVFEILAITYDIVLLANRHDTNETAVTGMHYPSSHSLHRQLPENCTVSTRTIGCH